MQRTVIGFSLALLFISCGGEEDFEIRGEEGKSEKLNTVFQAGKLVAPALGKEADSLLVSGSEDFCSRRMGSEECIAERSVYEQHLWQIDVRRTGILGVAITTGGSFVPHLAVSHHYTEKDGTMSQSLSNHSRRSVNEAIRLVDAASGRYEVVFVLPPKYDWFRFDDEDFEEYLHLYITTEEAASGDDGLIVKPPLSTATYEIELLDLGGEKITDVQLSSRCAEQDPVPWPTDDDYLELTFSDTCALTGRLKSGAFISEAKMKVLPSTSRPKMDFRRLLTDWVTHQDPYGGVITSTWKMETYLGKYIGWEFTKDKNIGIKELARIGEIELFGIPGDTLVELKAYDLRFDPTGGSGLLALSE